MKGQYSLASLLQTAKPRHPQPTAMFMDEMSHVLPQGQVATEPRKIKWKASTICTADISHTSERLQASGVHLSAQLHDLKLCQCEPHDT